MNWRCFFRHDFKEESRSNVAVWDSELSTSRPIERYTNFLLKCSKCGELKVVKLDGTWGEDDDDNDRDPPPSPQMSPDDFYEKVCKE